MDLSIYQRVDTHSWERWLLQSARTWEDLAAIVKETGVEPLNREHRNLIEIALKINHMIRRIEKGDYDKYFIESQSQLFDDLTEAVRHHFGQITALVRKYRIPNFKSSKYEYRRFLDIIHSMRRDFLGGQLSVSLELKSALLEWMINHINELVDRLFQESSWSGLALSRAERFSDIDDLVRSTSIGQLDGEHAKAIDALLDFDRLEPDASLAQLKVFKQLAETHFNFEQDLIKRFSPRDLEKHQRHSRAFLSLTDLFIDEVSEAWPEDAELIRLELLEGWLSHINGIDVKIFRGDRWVFQILARARKWEDVADLFTPLGHDRFDPQHREITVVALQITTSIEAFQDAKDDKVREVARKQCAAGFKSMLDKTSEHFTEEEWEMRKFDNSAQEGHRMEHKGFLKTLSGHHSDILDNRSEPSISMLVSVIEWWTRHSDGTDRLYFSTDEEKPQVQS